MSNPIDYLMQGALAGDYARGQEDNRNYRQQQTATAQDLSERQGNLDDMYVITGLATDLGVTSDASGEEIDPAKLSELWSKNVASGTIDPKLSQLAALLGNEDFAAQKNPGFSFKGASLGPDGTVTLQGGYEGDEEESRFLTVDRKGGDDAEVGFGDPMEISGLMANQYNQSMNKKGVSGLKRELQLKNDLIDSDQSVKGNNLKINNIVGGLTQELEQMIYSLSPEQAPAIVTKMKRQLAGVPFDQQLAILQNEGRKLGIPVDEVVPPEVKAEAEAGTPQQEAAAAPEAPDNSARIAEIEATLAKKPARSSRGVVRRRQELAAELKRLKAEPKAEDSSTSTLAGADAIRAKVLQKSRDEETNPELAKMAEVAETATDEDILEGKVEITQEQIVALQERLKAAGINTLEDMNKASLADQLKMKAALSTIAVNKDQRKTYLERMNNMMATGSADYDTKTLAAARVAQQQADTSSHTAQTSRDNSERLTTQMFETNRGGQGTFIGSKVKKVADLFLDKKGKATTPSVEEYKNAAMGPGGAISSLWGKTKEQLRLINNPKASTQQKKTAQQQMNMLQQALLAQISFGMQFMSQDGGLEWSMATDSGASLSGNDSALSRIGRDGNGYKIRRPGAPNQQDGDAFTETQFADFLGDMELKKFFDEKLSEIESTRAK